MNLYVAEHGNDEKKALSQLNQECGEEEIDEVEEFEIESSVENWASPMKVKTIARQFDVLYDLEPVSHFVTVYRTTKLIKLISLMLIWKST